MVVVGVVVVGSVVVGSVVVGVVVVGVVVVGVVVVGPVAAESVLEAVDALTAGSRIIFVLEKIVLPPLYLGLLVNCGLIARSSLVVMPLAAAISLTVSPDFTLYVTAGLAWVAGVVVAAASRMAAAFVCSSTVY